MIVLVAFLAGLALGAGVAAAILRRGRSPARSGDVVHVSPASAPALRGAPSLSEELRQVASDLALGLPEDAPRETIEGVLVVAAGEGWSRGVSAYREAFVERSGLPRPVAEALAEHVTLEVRT